MNNALITQLQTLKLYGMAQTVNELLARKTMPSLTACLQQLIDAETTERAVRAIRYRVGQAKSPPHKDFAPLTLLPRASVNFNWLTV